MGWLQPTPLPPNQKTVMAFRNQLRLAGLVLLLSTISAAAEEKEGLRVEIVPKIVADRSAPARVSADLPTVDKDMSLKATVKTSPCEIFQRARLNT